jgi:hypothetical protein
MVDPPGSPLVDDPLAAAWRERFDLGPASDTVKYTSWDPPRLPRGVDARCRQSYTDGMNIRGTILLSVLSLTSLLGCSKKLSEHPSCDRFGGQEGLCQDWAGPYYAEMARKPEITGAKSSCGGGVFHPDKSCPAAGLVASCRISPDQPQEIIMRFYPPWTAERAQSTCAINAGAVFVPN